MTIYATPTKVGMNACCGAAFISGFELIRGYHEDKEAKKKYYKDVADHLDKWFKGNLCETTIAGAFYFAILNAKQEEAYREVFEKYGWEEIYQKINYLANNPLRMYGLDVQARLRGFREERIAKKKVANARRMSRARTRQKEKRGC